MLRLSGIYGPGRHALLDRLRDDAATLRGDGFHWVNQIHRDDVVSAVLHATALEDPATGCRILNVTDDTPVLQRDYVEWLCSRLGRPPPRFAPGDREGGSGRRGEFQANRRISNRALRDLGWAPRFPSYREGMAPLVKAEG